jgi:hypothetical protein
MPDAIPVLVVMGRSWTNSVDYYAVLIERAEASFNISQGRRWGPTSP